MKLDLWIGVNSKERDQDGVEHLPGDISGSRGLKPQRNAWW